MAFRQSIQNELRAYPSKGKQPAVPEAQAVDRSLAILNAVAWNNSGSTQRVGLLRLLDPSQLKLYTLVSAVYTLETDIGSGVDIFTTTIGDGFALGHKRPPNLAGFVATVAGAGGVYDVQYWNGSAFVTIAAPLETGAFTSTGENYTVIQSPIDWVKGGPAGLDQNLFYLQVVSSTAPANNVTVDELWSGNFFTLWDGVLDKQAAQINFDWNKPVVLEANENVIPYYTTADSDNRVSIFFHFSG